MRVFTANKKPKTDKGPLVRTIGHLFNHKKGIQPHKLDPERYYKGYWFDRKTCDGIELVAAIEQISKKEAAHKLIEAGFKYYITEKTKQHIDNQVEINHRGEDPVVGRFIKLFRRYARQNGVDISKIL